MFPKRGEKYHKRGCTFLKTNTLSFALTPSIRKKYKKCPVCRSGKSANGTMVYVFPEYGESFHLQNCNVLQRKFTEIERETALERGYSPCGKRRMMVPAAVQKGGRCEKMAETGNNRVSYAVVS